MTWTSNSEMTGLGGAAVRVEDTRAGNVVGMEVGKKGERESMNKPKQEAKEG